MPEPEPSPVQPPANPTLTGRSRRVGRLLLGMLAGNAVGALLCGLVFGLVHFYPEYGGGVSLPSLLLIPFAIGLVASWVWGPLKLGMGGILLQSLGCTALGLAVGAVAFQEGVICLIILSPLLYVGVLAGAVLGEVLFRKSRARVNLCLAPFLALVILAEHGLRRPHTSVVVDEIRIAAPPAKVWPHILAFAPIPDPPDYWLFRLGLPYPTETTNGGDFEGADRACRFSGGAVFKERVARLDPGRDLVFDILEMPPDPELLGHLDAHRGEFELRDNGDGTTTLVGRTWYSLHVRPAFYFDWWTHQIFRAVHLRVMRNVKHLAEGQ